MTASLSESNDAPPTPSEQPILGPKDLVTAGDLNNCAVLMEDAGDYAGARPLHARALVICEQVLGSTHAWTVGRILNLAGNLTALNEVTAARSLYERAFAICEQAPNKAPFLIASVAEDLIQLLQQQGDTVTLRSLLERTCALYEQMPEPHDFPIAIGMYNLARRCYHEEQFNEAAQLLRRALQFFVQEQPNDAITQTAQALLATIVAQQAADREGRRIES